MSAASGESSGRKRRNILVLLPLLAFLALAALFFFRLGSGDPSRIPSALIGQPAPTTELPPLPGLERDGKAVPGLEQCDLQGRGDAGECVGVVVRAVPRRGAVPGAIVEGQAHPARRHQLQGRARQCAALSQPLRQSVRRHRPRRQRPLIDRLGRLWRAGDFLVGRDGRIAYKLVGPITADNLARVLAPEIEKAVAR